MRPPEEVSARDAFEGSRIAGEARVTLGQEPSRERLMELQKVEDEPVLKFQRMGADLGKLLSQSRETIVRMAVHDTLLVFGTSSGVVILSDYHGNESRRMRLHSKAVTDLSMDITGDFLARQDCSEDGTVAVTGLQPGSGGEQTPPDVYNYGMRWPMRAVRLDPLYARRKDKIFVAGGDAGKMLLNKKRWLSNDETELHKGEGVISAIAWRGPLVAWASEGGIKIMDVEKGKAGKPISYVDKPRSLEEFRDYGCRCHLLWETPTSLLVGWGDTVMVLQILVREPRHKRTTSLSGPYHSQNPSSASVPLQNSVPLTLTNPGGLPMGVIATAAAASPVALEGPERYTQIVAVWQADCLVCGLSPFDADSIVLLGHPVDEFDEDYEDGGGMEGSVGAVVFGGEDVPASGSGQGSAPSTVFQPEMQLVRRTTGEVISSDTLALKDWEASGAGDLLLHSTCWSTSSYRQDKEGETTAFYSPSAAMASTVRGLPPATFILSPRDIIVARVRDIDDKVTWSLQKGDLLGAVDVAIGHRHLLRVHDFQDLVSRYLDDLMSKGEFRLAAADCPRLLNGDSTAWERWVYGFARRRHLPAIVPYIPTKDPRLPAPVYEVVLEHLLLTEPGLFLETLRRWGHPRGKHGGQHGGRASAGRIAPGEWAGAGTEGRVDGHAGQEAQQELYSLPVMMARMEASLVRRPDPVIMEAQAEAYVMDRQFARAIRAYLALAEHRDDASVARRKLRSSLGGERKPREEDGEEEGARRYGHVFRMIEQHSLLDTVKDRVLQLIKLDQELTGELLLRHPEKISVPSVVKQLEGRRDLQHWYLGLLFDRCPEMYGAQEFAPFHVLQVSLHAEFAPPFKPGHPPPYNSAFMRFLRGSGFVPLEAARQACEARVPPLYDEMAYIYARMGETERALTILLENVGSVPRAIEFVETHDKQLLSKLVKHSHKDEAFLSGLLDHVGVYDLDLAQLVKDIHPRTRIPGLRDKVIKIISDCRFQVRVNESCCASVKSDLLRRLRRLNQGQRRALLVEPGSRCSYSACRMPLNGPPRGFGIGDAGGLGAASGYAQVSGRSGEDADRGDVAQPSPGGGGGGRRRTRGGMLVFPCGHKFHEFCHEISSGAWGRGAGEGGGGGVRVCSICSKQKTARSNLVNLRLAPDKSRLPSS